MASNTAFKERTKEKPKPQVEYSIPLPVAGGRQTFPDGSGTLGSFFSELAFVEPDFPQQLLEGLEMLAKYHGDVSLAVENIVALGNTPFTIEFDDKVKDPQAKEMRARLKNKEKEWYAYSGGVQSLINDLLAQIAISGCLSVENIPENDLSGIKKVAIVAPKHIRFRYDKVKDNYMPYQSIPTGIAAKADAAGLIELNPVTFKYSTLRRFSEKPYPVPPFLAALFHINVEKDMMDNMKFVMKKLGVLGFLEVLINAPKPTPNEDETKYFDRSKKYLDQIVPEIEKGMAKGYVTGFEGRHTFNMHNTSSNLQGAKELIEVNDTKKMAGLKQDPLMFGRNFSTTETLGRVILAKMTAQIANYQNLIATYLANLFLIDLQLAGYKIENVDVTFEKALIGDKLRDEQAFQVKIANVDAMYNSGVISQTQRAQLLTFEKADQEEPRVVNTPPAKGKADKGNPDATDPKTTGSNKKLLSWQMQRVAELPESGMGYHVLDFWLKSGTCVQTVVLNGEFTQDEIKLNKVVSIEPVGTMNLGDLAQIELVKAGGKVKQYEYDHEGCTCDNFAKSDNPDITDFVNRYYDESKVKYDKAVQKITKNIADKMLLLSEDADEQTVIDSVLYTLYKDWHVTFTATAVATITKFVKEAYTYFRKDKSIFGSKAKDIPTGVFDAIDLRALDYYKNSDTLYLGKFITDEDLKKKITQYIKDEYLTRNLPIGNNTAALSQFKEKFAGVLDGQDWKIKRVVDTTVNSMRNAAAVNYMQQAAVDKFEIRGVVDRLQCPYCRNLQGKSFSVQRTVTKLDNMMKVPPEQIGLESPFLTSVFKNPDDMKNLSGDEIQDKGFGLIPAHCGCRDQVVAVI